MTTGATPTPIRPRVRGGEIAIVLTILALIVLGGILVSRPPLEVSAPAPTPEPPSQGRDDPDEIAAWLSESRGIEDEALPVERYVATAEILAEAIDRRQDMVAAGNERATILAGIGAVGSPWQWLGPDNFGGRTRAFAVSPADSSVMLAAGITGGIWRSSDAGESWRPMTDSLANIAVGVLEIDPGDPSVVYAGTGEAYYAPWPRHRGDGIMRSTDAGRTWRFLPATTGRADFSWVGDVEVSHNDSRRIYAATRNGVWLSTDGGASWGDEPVLSSTSGVGCMELAIRTDLSPDTIFASCGYEDGPDGVHRSVDGGVTWQRVLPRAEDGELGVIALAIAPSDQDVIYASASDTLGHARALFASVHGGAPGSWEVRAQGGSAGVPDWLTNCRYPDYAQGGYDNTIAVDPTDADRLWLGGIDLFRSEDGGRTITIASDWAADPDAGTYVHADQHLILFAPTYDGSTNRTVYFANDGGLYRTDNDRADLTGAACGVIPTIRYRSLNNGYGVIQFVGGSVSDDGNWVVGGSQDNGTFFLGARGSPDTWLQIQGGDGGNSLIDSANGMIIASYPNFDFWRWNGSTWANASAGISDRGLFYPPLEADPNNGASIWTGGGSVWRSLDHGASWTKVSPLLPAAASAIAVASSDANVVYVGTVNGYVYRTGDALAASPTWTDTDPALALPGGRVSSIAIDPADPDTVLVTYANFDGKQVWKTTAGVTGWRNLDETLPDLPINAIAINPRNTSMVYAGTDMGVFESLDAGETWRVANENLASTIVSRLAFRGDSSELYVFTHGRGAYVVNVGDRSPPAHDERASAITVELAPAFEHQVDIRAATPAASDPDLSCGFPGTPQQTRSVWYLIPAGERGRYSISTAGSTYDTVLAVFAAGAGPTLEEVACNDDTQAAGGGSQLVFNAAAGTTYYIEVTRSADAASESVGNRLVLSVTRAGG